MQLKYSIGGVVTQLASVTCAYLHGSYSVEFAFVSALARSRWRG